MRNIKTGIKNKLAFILTLTTMLTVGCSSDEVTPVDTDDPQVRVMANLVESTWVIQSVKVDEIDQGSLFEGFSLVFEDGTYTTFNGGNVWPASGTWTFTDENATSITRDDGTLVTINALTQTSLVLALDWTESSIGPGRTESISGEHIFTFRK